MRRRSFLTGLVTLATPAIVRAESIYVPVAKPKLRDGVYIEYLDESQWFAPASMRTLDSKDRTIFTFYPSALAKVQIALLTNTISLASLPFPPIPSVPESSIWPSLPAPKWKTLDASMAELVKQINDSVGITFNDAKAFQIGPQDGEGASLQRRLQRCDEGPDPEGSTSRFHRD